MNHLHRAVVEEVASAVVDLLAICPLVLEFVEAATNVSLNSCLDLSNSPKERDVVGEVASAVVIPGSVRSVSLFRHRYVN